MPSIPPFRDKNCRFSEQVRSGAERRQQIARLIDQAGELSDRPVEPVEGGKGRLAAAGILAGRLADTRRVTGQVEQIVGKLEGEADRGAELGEPLALGSGCFADDGTGLAGKADQG